MYIKSAVAALLALGFASCADDLNISPIDPQTSSSYEPMQLLAKQYATLALTGQKGGAGSDDLSGEDEGEKGFYRTTFNLQELPADECIWAWQTDPDIPQLTGMMWSKNSSRTNWAYQRLGFNITQYNFFLQETEGSTGEVAGYRAEVRFLRALHYWYFLDLWHKAPFKIDFNLSNLPVQKEGKELYDWLDNELTEIENDLPEIGAYNNAANFGRVDKGAAYMLHARLALNSAVYTDGQTKDYDKAINYCDLLINSGKYELSKNVNTYGYTGYEQVFMADNDENPQAMKEIIFPIRQDGAKTRSWTCAQYLIASTRTGGMPYCNTTDMWGCNFAHASLIEKFFPTITDCPIATEEKYKNATQLSSTKSAPEDSIYMVDAEMGVTTRDVQTAANDDRALFYGGIGGEKLRTLRADNLSNDFYAGLSIVKFSNMRSDRDKKAKDRGTHDVKFMDMDVPLIRYAEAYLTRAEARYRKEGATQKVADDLNELRDRARASQFQVSDLNDRAICDEWCREFYMEGRRRSDLVRFDFFTTDKYMWDWKGLRPEGKEVKPHFNLYAIPDDDINGNKNMKQNPGF